MDDINVRKWQSVSELASALGTSVQTLRAAARRGIFEVRDVTYEEATELEELWRSERRRGFPHSTLWRLPPHRRLEEALPVLARRRVRVPSTRQVLALLEVPTGTVLTVVLPGGQVTVLTVTDDVELTLGGGEP